MGSVETKNKNAPLDSEDSDMRFQIEVQCMICQKALKKAYSLSLCFASFR